MLKRFQWCGLCRVQLLSAPAWPMEDLWSACGAGLESVSVCCVWHLAWLNWPVLTQPLVACTIVSIEMMCNTSWCMLCISDLPYQIAITCASLFQTVSCPPVLRCGKALSYETWILLCCPVAGQYKLAGPRVGPFACWITGTPRTPCSCANVCLPPCPSWKLQHSSYKLCPATWYSS